MSKSAESGCYNWKYIKDGSKFKYVRKYVDATGGEYWVIKPPNSSSKEYPTEREAAKAIDIFLINKGKEPVNILKRK